MRLRTKQRSSRPWSSDSCWVRGMRWTHWPFEWPQSGSRVLSLVYGYIFQPSKFCFWLASEWNLLKLKKKLRMDGISQWEFALAYYGLLSSTVDYIFDKFDIDQKGIDVVTRNRLVTTTNFREFMIKFLTEEVQQVKWPPMTLRLRTIASDDGILPKN